MKKSLANSKFSLVPKRFARLMFALPALILALPAAAIIVGPYAQDAQTLHLWHLDEVATPSVDSGVSPTNLVGLLNGATLGNPSYTGFGNAVNTADGGEDATVAGTRDAVITPSTSSPPANVQFTYANSTNGAFTYEAMVWIGFDPDKNLGPTANGGNNRGSPCAIIGCESGANAGRIFQFRIFPKGNTLTAGVIATNGPFLTFENVRAVSGNQPTIYAPIPTNGPDAIVSNNWYHAAVTYNGVPNTAGNIKFYWTLLDPSRTFANQIPITSAQTTLSGPNPLSTTATPFTIGNLGRLTGGNLINNFLGAIDEVRISNVARKATEMMFNSVDPLVVTSPASQTVPLGQPVSFNVLAAGATPLFYQWRLAGTNLPGATQDTFSIASAQPADEGSYDVVISNSFSSVTSPPAILTVRLPVDLTWIGSAAPIWNTTLINWDTNADNVADAPFLGGDNVTFNAGGSAAPVVLLTNAVNPSSVTVNASTDYTLTTTNNAGIAGISRLVKSGTGTLILDTDNTFAGPSTIQAGAVQLGNATPRGTLGNGPITNNGALLIFRTGGLTLNNPLTGTGSLTNNATNTVTISGSNTLSGPMVLNAGAISLTGPHAKGNATEIVLNATATAAPTRLTLGGGITLGPSITASLLGTTTAPDYRCSLTTSDSTNTINCQLVLGGDGTIQFSADGTSRMEVITPTLNSPAFTGKLILRGNGTGLFTSKVDIGGHLSKTDGGTWVITSTGNAWTNTDVAGGTLRMGAHNVFPGTNSLNMTTATGFLDLAGFNQQVDTLNGPGTIGNSSTSSDATLTVAPTSLSLYSGALVDSLSGGTRRTRLTVASGAQALSGTNTYSGDTTINGGSLQLFIEGSISNSATVFVAHGATLDASARNDITFTVSPVQTLTGNGAFNVTGNLASEGTIRLKLNKSGATLTNDSINGVSQFTFGGILRLDITASPALTTSDSFKVFNAVGYVGAFTDIIPAPGFGLAWDTSTLATDGTLRIATSTTATTSTNISFALSGNQLELSWPQSHVGWRLQGQTNSITVGLSANWFEISGSTMTNRLFVPINPLNGTVFYRMVFP